MTNGIQRKAAAVAALCFGWAGSAEASIVAALFGGCCTLLRMGRHWYCYCCFCFVALEIACVRRRKVLLLV